MTETSTNTNSDVDDSSIVYPTADTSHVGLDMELYRFDFNGNDIIVHDWAEGTQVYTAVSTTTSVKKATNHDGPAIQNGHFVKFIQRRDDDDPNVVTTHPMIGVEDHYLIDEELEKHVVLLTELDRNPVPEKGLDA